MIRNWISVKIARHSNLKEKTNWNAAALHDVKTCICDRGDIGRKKKKEANKKPGNFTKLREVLPSKRCTRKEWSLRRVSLDNYWQ